MTQYYLFQHTDKLSALLDEPDFKFPDNFTEYTEVESQYVIDPLFYKKVPNMADVNKFKDYYHSWYGDVDYNILEWAPFNQSDNIYLLENTSFKDSQKNGYSTGIIFYASVDPVSVYKYDEKTNNTCSDARQLSKFLSRCKSRLTVTSCRSRLALRPIASFPT